MTNEKMLINSDEMQAIIERMTFQIIEKITQPESNSILFWHYGVFDFNIKYIQDFSKVVFIYHNITPAKYFWFTDPLSSFRAIGTYAQLYYLNKRLKWISVSTFNKYCLSSFGFKFIEECAIIPYKQNKVNKNIAKQPVCTLIYVGRIIENKNCLELIEYVKDFALLYRLPVNFIVIGKYSSQNRYCRQFKNVWDRLSTVKNITLQWSYDIDNEELISLYKSSWLYVTTSLHEGLGIPVCEAVLNGTPALYLECGGQESILDSIGMIALNQKDKFPEKILELILDITKREALLQMQYDKLQNRSYPNCKQLIKEVYGRYL